MDRDKYKWLEESIVQTFQEDSDLMQEINTLEDSRRGFTTIDAMTENFDYQELPAVQVIADEIPFSTSEAFGKNTHEDTLNARVYTITKGTDRESVRETLSAIIYNIERVANKQRNSQDNWGTFNGLTLSVVTARDIKKSKSDFIGRAETQITVSKVFSY